MKVFQLALLALCAAAAMAHTAGKSSADAAVVDGADRVDVSGSGSGSGSGSTFEVRVEEEATMSGKKGKKAKKAKKAKDMSAASPGLRVGSGSGKGKGGKLQATSGFTQHSVVGVAVMGVAGIAVGVAALAVRKNRMSTGYSAVTDITDVTPTHDATEHTPLVEV
eukprot:m.60623 g.60623  ORF g.60623 m.60623 type:complete len:165 (-) comp17469_c0_seq3:120-614(-)